MDLTTILSLAVLGQVVLPGHDLSLQQAREEARIIVVAEVVRTEDVLGIGAFSLMTGVELKPSIVLKGKREELKDLSVTASGPERLPEKGQEYIFFIKEYKRHHYILKMLPKTEENLAALEVGRG